MGTGLRNGGSDVRPAAHHHHHHHHHHHPPTHPPCSFGKGPSQKYIDANEVKYFSLGGEGVGDFMVTISLFQKQKNWLHSCVYHHRMKPKVGRNFTSERGSREKWKIFHFIGFKVFLRLSLILDCVLQLWNGQVLASWGASWFAFRHTTKCQLILNLPKDIYS